MSGYFAKPSSAIPQKGHRQSASLVGAWLMREGSGLTIHDNANGMDVNALTLTNGPLWTHGLFGSCLDFDGTNDHALGTASQFSFEYSQPFSFAAWIQLDSASNTIISKSLAVSPFTGWTFDFTTSKLRLSIVNSTVTPHQLNVNGGTTLSTATWYHVGFTYDGSSLAAGAQIYLNGKAEAMTTVANTLGTNSIITTAVFTIGARNGANFPLNGRIDSPMIWTRALSAQDFRNLYADHFRAFRRRQLPVPLHTAAAATTTRAAVIGGGVGGGPCILGA